MPATARHTAFGSLASAASDYLSRHRPPCAFPRGLGHIAPPSARLARPPRRASTSPPHKSPSRSLSAAPLSPRRPRLPNSPPPSGNHRADALRCTRTTPTSWWSPGPPRPTCPSYCPQDPRSSSNPPTLVSRRVVFDGDTSALLPAKLRRRHGFGAWAGCVGSQGPSIACRYTRAMVGTVGSRQGAVCALR